MKGMVTNFAMLARCLIFFFQAEDGIRDLTVTGVQTCALPISPKDLRRLGAGVNLASLLAEPAQEVDDHVGGAVRVDGVEAATTEADQHGVGRGDRKSVV